MTSAAPSLKKVLLVDDDKVTNMMHGRLIERSGLIAQIDVATDGVAALDYLRGTEDWPELILLDINMPRMDGFEFLDNYANLIAEGSDGKPVIIMLSTSVLRADLERAEADPNVHSFASKPMRGEDVAGFVEVCHARLLN